MAERNCQEADNRRCESRSVKDAFGRGYSRKRSECGARGREDTARSRAAWASPCRHYDRRVRCFHWTGTGAARVTPVERRALLARKGGQRITRSGRVPGSMA